MAEIVYGDQALSEPVQQLARLFQDNRYEGTLFSAMLRAPFE